MANRNTIAVAASIPWVAVVGMCALQGEAFTSLHGQRAKPPVPYEDIGACPFEGCVYRAWTANAPVSVRSDRKASAPVVYAISRGEQVTALTGVVVIVKPGRVQFPKAVTLRTASGSLSVAPGQTLFLLTYRGEGFFKAWFEGRMYDELDGTIFYNGVCDFEPARCTGKIVERTESIWWVQVRNRRGQTGWTRDVGKFDGKDALDGKAPRSYSALHPAGADRTVSAGK
ncbi:MAG: hypothetical protein NTV05_06250 [Acidobacteria bacterium]|nr:hypothetical protein [Acidobacteriota bacterium]